MKKLIVKIFDDFSQCEPIIVKIADLRRKIRELHWKMLEENYRRKKIFFMVISVMLRFIDLFLPILPQSP